VIPCWLLDILFRLTSEEYPIANTQFPTSKERGDEKTGLFPGDW
jgi:hypothetical protein